MTNTAGVSVLKRALLATLKLHFFGVKLLIFDHLWPHFNTEKLSTIEFIKRKATVHCRCID